MASQDFIYDLLDKIEEDQLEYVLLTMRSNERESAGDLFYNFYFQDSKENAVHILREIADKLENSNGEEIDDIEIDLNNEDDE